VPRIKGVLGLGQGCGLTVELVADPKVYEWQINQIPLRRGAEPHEVAGAIAFMASDDASYMTGSFMFVDGGLTAI